MVASYTDTVRVNFPVGRCPAAVDQAAEELGVFGDIARLDTSLSLVQSAVIVTYFDVRCAQALLTEYDAFTEAYPPATGEFRTVRANMAAFVETVGAIGGFSSFGDVAHVDLVGGDALVEFYDSRSAQGLLASVSSAGSPACFPQEHIPEVYPPGLLPLGKPAVGNCSVSQLTVALAAKGDVQPAQETRRRKEVHVPAQSSADGRKSNQAKVSNKDFQMYEINPTKVRAGRDARTTVMVRRLTGGSARNDLLALLERCGLEERYTFFYMPLKEHRNVYAGFAFVNFGSPEDVLKLYFAVQRGIWKEVATDPEAPSPRLSYARFQGHEELMSHFSSSAILRAPDPSKRPIFRESIETSSPVPVRLGAPPGLAPMPEAELPESIDALDEPCPIRKPIDKPSAPLRLGLPPGLTLVAEEPQPGSPTAQAPCFPPSPQAETKAKNPCFTPQPEQHSAEPQVLAGCHKQVKGIPEDDSEEAPGFGRESIGA